MKTHTDAEGTYTITKTLDWGTVGCTATFRNRTGLLKALDRTLMDMGTDIYAFYAYGMEKKHTVQQWRRVNRYVRALERIGQCCTPCQTDAVQRETNVTNAAKHALQKYIVKWQ